MLTCYECGKQIKGEVLHSDPPLYMIQLGIDFPKAFHPKCYKKAETEAKEAINGKL